MALPRSVANLALSFGFGVGFARGISETPQTETHAHARVDDTALLRARQRRHNENEVREEKVSKAESTEIVEDKRGVRIVPFSLEKGIPPEVIEQIKLAELGNDDTDDVQGGCGSALSGGLFHPPNHGEFELAMGAVMSRREMLGNLLQDTQERQRQSKWAQNANDREDKGECHNNDEIGVDDDTRSTISTLSCYSRKWRVVIIPLYLPGTWTLCAVRER